MNPARHGPGALWAYWRHNLDPFIIRFYAEYGIRWYGLAYVLGVLFGWWMFRRWQQAGRLPLREKEVADFAFAVVIGMMVGARLGYCVFYAWEKLVANPLFVLDIFHGGMSSHGGVMGLCLGVVIYARKKKREPLVLADTVAAVIPMGIIAGRLANFINGELWGRPTDVPWAIIFPHAAAAGGLPVPRHPSQLYPVFWKA